MSINLPRRTQLSYHPVVMASPRPDKKEKRKDSEDQAGLSLFLLFVICLPKRC